MAVDTPDDGYAALAPTWAKIRALMSGADRARAMVSRLPGHDDATHAQYAQQAYFLPALARTVESFGGLIFGRDAAVTAPDAARPYIDDIGLDGTGAIDLAEQIVDEVLTVNRCAVLVDYPEAPASDRPLTVGEAQRQGVRAYARLYRAEDVLGARYQSRGGVRVLVQVRLAERYEIAVDEFTAESAPAVRVLDLIDGRYRQRLFVRRKDASEWAQLGPDRYPMRRGRQLDAIPIVFFSATDNDARPRRPALADLADVNIAHLNASARREWALMWTGNPTPCFKGISPQVETLDDGSAVRSGPTIRLGSSEGLLFEPDGDAWFLEFEGKGLESLRADCEDKRRDLAVLGARILLDDPRTAIAADALRIQRSGEHSILGGIAATVSQGVTRVLRLIAEWDGIAGEIAVELNREFVPQSINPQELQQLLAAVQSGEISRRDFFERLKTAGLIRAEKTFDEHRAEIEEDGGPLLNRLGTGDA